MFIPFSAIRFGKKDVQDWGLNITRRRRKTEQQYTWNPIDPNVNGFLTQEGIWKGLSNIKPPLRLQFSPYFSTYANHYPYNKPGVKKLDKPGKWRYGCEIWHQPGIYIRCYTDT